MPVRNREGGNSLFAPMVGDQGLQIEIGEYIGIEQYYVFAI